MMRNFFLIACCVSLVAMIFSCSEKDDPKDNPPELMGIWGSVNYYRNDATLSVRDSVTGKWERILFKKTQFEISPKDSSYTMLKFSGKEIFLMNLSPYFSAAAGEPYPFTLTGDTLTTDLLPYNFKGEVYIIEDLTLKTFKLVRKINGPSLHNNGDSIWEGYESVMTFSRLK